MPPWRPCFSASASPPRLPGGARWSGHGPLDRHDWMRRVGAAHSSMQKEGLAGLPNVKDATEKQIKTSMYWSNPDELYNGGKPLKITLRDERGIMVTILAG